MARDLKKRLIGCWPDVLFLATAIWLFGPVLFSGGTRLIDDTDDPARNYFANGWIIKHQSGLWNCEGVNYPYGENIFYIDCNPLFLVITKSITTVLPFLENHWLFILHSLYALSFALAGIWYHRIFRQWGANQVTAFLCAFAILGLSPQMFRLGGHLGLGIMCFFPAMILLFSSQRKKATHYILIMLSACASALSHPYLGAITAGTFILTAFFSIVFSGFRFRNKDTQVFLVKAAAVILGTGIFYALVYLTDHHPGRTTLMRLHPDNYATWKGLFTTYKEYFIRDFLVIKYRDIGYESIVYPGIIALLTAIPAGALLLMTLRNKNPEQVFLRSFILAAICLYIFAMGYPMRWAPGYFDKTLIEQFRVLNRFSWPAAYAFLLISGWFFIQLQKKWPGVFVSVLLLPVLLFPVFESGYRIRELHRQIGDPNFLYLEVPQPVHSTDFLLPVPTFSTGSDLIHRQATQEALLRTYGASYSRGLPMIGGHLIRTSIPETENWINGLAQNGKSSFQPGNALLFMTGKPQTLLEEILVRSSQSTTHPDFFTLDFSQVSSLRADTLFYMDYEELADNIPGRTSKGLYVSPGEFRSALTPGKEWLKNTGPWFIRFWYNCRELHGRDHVVLLVNKDGEWLKSVQCSQVSEVQSEWALVDLAIHDLPAPGDSVTVVFHNYSTPAKPLDFIVDDLEILLEKE